MGKLRCPICRSKQWRKEPSSGMLICGEGHVLQGYRKETREVTEMSQHMMHKRTLKKTPTTSQVTQMNSTQYSGEEAQFLYSQSLQLLLRLQIAVLQKLWSLPTEFEAMCRDVWSLHLLILPRGIMGPDVDSGAEAPQKHGQADAHTGVVSDSEDESEASQDGGADTEKEAADNDLAKLLAGLSDASSDEEDSQSDEERSMPATYATENRSKTKLVQPYNMPLSNIAVLVTACWMMRIPVIYMDFVRLIQAYELPYLDPIQRGLVPKPMVTRMRKEVIKALSPLHPPRPLELHRLTSRLAREFKDRYQISVPEINAPHILVRSLDSLRIPTGFYSMAKVLANRLAVPLTLHPSLSAVVTNERGKALAYQVGDNIPPEMALTCVIVLLLKLLYGLDGRTREFSSLDLPTKAEILSVMQREEDATSAVRELNALDLSDPEIDRYLDFATSTLLGEQTEESDPSLHSAFPLHPRTSSNSSMPHWPTSRPTAVPQTPIPGVIQYSTGNYEPESTPSGQKHTIYCTTDILGSLPEEYQLILSCAARWCGTSNDDIASIVEKYERRLLRQLEKVAR